jgi:hypothetical protein
MVETNSAKDTGISQGPRCPAVVVDGSPSSRDRQSINL